MMETSTLAPSPAARTQPGPIPLWLVAAVLFVLSILVAPRAAASDEPSAPPPGDVANLETLQQAFQQVIQRVTPSVVGIRAERRYVTPLSGAREDDPAAVEQRVLVNGSGAFVAAGLILTNEHVVHATNDIGVLFYDGHGSAATVVAADARADLAVLRVPRTDLPPVTICDWSSVARGQWSIVLGNPFGLGSDGQLSAAIGVVANLGRQLPGLGETDDRFYNDMIQTTAAINPGHSGGPLFNVRGELLGIVTAIYTRAPADQGVGFAIPMSPTKRRIIDTLCQGQPIEYGYLGVTARSLDPAERGALGLAASHGVVVQQVEPDGPAGRAEVRVGDLILQYAGQPVGGPAQLAEQVGQTPVGTVVKIDVVRDGQPLPAEVTVGLRDATRVSWLRAGGVLWRGMRLANLTDELRERFGLDGAAQGVIVMDVLADSPAKRAGIQAGDVIEEVAGEHILDTRDFWARARTKVEAVDLLIRGHGKRTIPA